MVMFSFSIGEKVIWLAPATRSIYATFLGVELKDDGNEWAKIQPLPGMSERFSGEAMMVLADQLVPAF